MNKLDAIFSPKSVAILGASTTPGKVGHDMFANILKGGYTGTLYPVNPKSRSISCVRCFPSILDVPEAVDLAIVVLPPEMALKAVDESIRSGIKGLVIVSAGFKEVGGEGVEMEQTISSMCREAGVRLVGPNCLGVINPMPAVKMNASFSARMPQTGNISFVSQSGALCTAVLDYAADRDFGFSKFISVGNKADVDELDLLRYLHNDPDTNVILMYMEELRRGAEFIQEVRTITSGCRPTPILAIKSGRTSAGAKAAASHTGSLAGAEAVYDSIFEQCGIIRVDTIDELFDYANAFAFKRESQLGKLTRKVPGGNRVAIVTNAGGPGILATDMTMSKGLRLADFQDETIARLKEHLPSAASFTNPVDVIGDAHADRYEHALEAVIDDPGVDGALVILTPQSMTNVRETADAIIKIARRSPKPVLSSFMGVVDVSSGVKYLQKQGYPVYKFPENAAKAFGALFKYSQWTNRQLLPQFEFSHDRKRAAGIIANCLTKGQTYLGELDGLEVLKCYGFNVLATELATSPEQAADIAEKIGFPVVMKIVSPQIIHKSDAGGVKVGLQNGQEVKEAFASIVNSAGNYNPDAEITGVLVQKMAPSGHEVIVGANRYPVFGPLLMFGLGGVFVELFKDVTFRLAPIGRNEARSMIHNIKGIKMLQGFRGAPEADMECLEKTMVCLSDMLLDLPEIDELDINPLLVHTQGEGATVADCRIMLKAVDPAGR